MINEITYGIFDEFPEISCRTLWKTRIATDQKTDGADWTGEIHKIIESYAQPPVQMAAASQVHGNTVEMCHSSGIYDNCDGLLTDRCDLKLLIRTADCAAVMIYDSGSRQIVNLHAGWRGARANIIRNAVQKLPGIKDDARISDLWIAIGPMIRSCCYRVGPEFYSYFDPRFLARRNSGSYFDLPGVLAEQLFGVGISPDHIEFSPECTCCSRLNLPSFRRDNTTHRLYNLIEQRTKGDVT